MQDASMSEAGLIKVEQRALRDIDPDKWDALVSDASPFLKHAFLLALEESGSVSPATGWQPNHLAIYDSEGLLAALPLYIKSHSWGEYVFDWAWADAYRRYGQRYYPKLVSAIPYTPSPSPRLLVRSDTDTHQRLAIFQAMHEAVAEQATELGASSWHVLFPAPDESRQWQTLGMARRDAVQFHWFNRGYRDFDDFLAGFSSRKRKSVRRERADVAHSGFRFVCLEGPDMGTADWDTFFRFYQNTYHVRGQEAYLNREFFALIGASLARDLFVIFAEKGGEYVAAALFFKSRDTLFGRYWGADADYYNLHFETCYYQGIDYCIRYGLQKFDAGAQGEHKLRRGFEPVTTFSCHWIAEPAFRRAIAHFCSEEAAYIAGYREQAEGSLPFRRDGGLAARLQSDVNQGSTGSASPPDE